MTAGAAPGPGIASARSYASDASFSSQMSGLSRVSARSGRSMRSTSSMSTTLTTLNKSKAALQDELFRVSLRLDRCVERRKHKKRMPGLLENPRGAQDHDFNDHLHKL